MARAENNVSGLVRYAWDKIGGLLFRNNVGGCWQSSIPPKMKYGRTGKLETITLIEPRWMAYGLKKGSGDWIGPTPIVITQAMVGKKIGVFTSIEMKADTDATKEQEDWMTLIKSYGGIAFIARGDKRLPDPQSWEFPDAKNPPA